MSPSAWLALVSVCVTTAVRHNHEWKPMDAEDMLRIVESKEYGPWIKERYRKKLGMELPDGTLVNNDTVTPTDAAVQQKVVEKAKCEKSDQSSACGTKLLLCQSEAFAQTTQLECPVTCAVGACGTKRPPFSHCAGATRSTEGITKLISTSDTSGTGLWVTEALTGKSGALLSKTAWTPKTSEGAVLEAEVPTVEEIVGVSVQGEADASADTGAVGAKTGWVKTFKLKYWDEGLQVWMDVVGKEGGALIFPGNTDPNTVVHSYFTSPVKTTKLKFIPLDFHNKVSMRVGLQVCDPRKPPPPVKEPPKETKVEEGSPEDKQRQQIAERVKWIGGAINKTKGLHVSPEEIERVVSNTPNGLRN